MRNMKKFLALVLAMVMVFSMAVITTSAADEADYTDAAMQLNALSVMLGNESGDLMLDAGVTRYQTALFFVRALTGKTDTAVWNAEKTSAHFADVNEYGTAIDYAYGVNVVKGRGNGVFGFNDPILYQDMIVMAVRALGYETADMQYPYGHILAAQKLELLEGIDNVNYKAEFKRGETAQLIWNMLNTEIAVVDPLSDKILYPGEEGLTEALTDNTIERTTLLVESGFASGTLEAVIVDFEEADEDDEDDYDKLTINYTYVDDNPATTDVVETVDVEGVVIAAADLGITVDTPTVTYKGLPVTLYVDCAAEDFEAEYADEEATIVFADFANYTVVKNDGSADNIKYVAATTPYISIDGVKFADNKYHADVYTFGADGWDKLDSDDTLALIKAWFEYDTKDGYVSEAAGANTYGQVAYRVTDKTMTFGEDEKTCIEILYTPYTFGQYVERELKYNVTGKTEKFVVIGNITDTETVNADGVKSYVKETLLGTTSVVGENTTAVSKRNGELAVEATVTGVEVKSGDFMFYAYNPVDNILTVAANCGTLETGRATATTATAGKESVKIGGTNYKFGWDGLYPEFTAYDNADIKGYISNLEAGKDNVQYLTVNDKIVFLAGYEGESEAAEYNFAIVTLDDETMAELLDTTTTKYGNKLIGKLDTFTDGLYVDGGYVLVAMLNTESGEWELAKVKEFALDYDDQDASDKTEYDFTTYVDLATIAGYAEITTNVTGAADYVEAATALTSANLFMVVEEEDGVYTLAAATTVDPENENAPFIESVENTTGLVFNTAGRTNLITASEDVDAARISTTEDTVIVAIGSRLDDVQVRKGVQSDKKSIAGTVNFYAADANLIVLTATSLAENWGTGSALASDATYYVVLPETATEYGTTEDGESTLTISGLFDLKTMEIAEDLVITAEENSDLDDEEAAVSTYGTLVYLNEDGELSAPAKSIATALKEILAEEDDDAFVADVLEWVDNESITVKNGDVEVTNAANAIAGGINATVITLDLTDIDWAEDVDTDNFFVGPGVAFDADAYEDLGLTEIVVKGGLERYNYHADLGEVVAEITEPTLGLYSQFEIDMATKTVYELVDIEENGVAIYDVDYYTAAIYDEDTETLELYIVKLVNAK